MIAVQHSILSPAALLKVIQRYYPRIGATTCELMGLGCNDHYRIKAKRQDYAFRLYRLAWWPEQEVDEELRMLEIMHRKQLNVCKPVRNVNKQRYIKVNAPEGTRFGALFSFIPGEHLGFRLGSGNQRLVRLGNLVADMHTITDTIKQPIQR